MLDNLDLLATAPLNLTGQQTLLDTLQRHTAAQDHRDAVSNTTAALANSRHLHRNLVPHVIETGGYQTHQTIARRTTDPNHIRQLVEHGHGKAYLEVILPRPLPPAVRNQLLVRCQQEHGHHRTEILQHDPFDLPQLQQLKPHVTYTKPLLWMAASQHGTAVVNDNELFDELHDQARRRHAIAHAPPMAVIDILYSQRPQLRQMMADDPPPAPVYILAMAVRCDLTRRQQQQVLNATQHLHDGTIQDLHNLLLSNNTLHPDIHQQITGQTASTTEFGSHLHQLQDQVATFTRTNNAIRNNMAAKQAQLLQLQHHLRWAAHQQPTFAGTAAAAGALIAAELGFGATHTRRWQATTDPTTTRPHSQAAVGQPITGPDPVTTTDCVASSEDGTTVDVRQLPLPLALQRQATATAAAAAITLAAGDDRDTWMLLWQMIADHHPAANRPLNQFLQTVSTALAT